MFAEFPNGMSFADHGLYTCSYGSQVAKHEIMQDVECTSEIGKWIWRKTRCIQGMVMILVQPVKLTWQLYNAIFITKGVDPGIGFRVGGASL